MAFRGLKLFSRITRTVSISRYNAVSSVAQVIDKQKTKLKEYKTEDNFVYLEDPDTFGTLSGSFRTQAHEVQTLEDEDDMKEHQFIENRPLPSQKFTIKQYADLIKQYLKHKRLKEAIDILEVRMITQDRVKPENYIYNILIGACAEVGYTRKAFKLFNDMKRRALKPTGDTYTCLFEACANSPWASDGLKNAHHLRTLMIEKGIKPNLTNFNAMIKAFGRCGDLTTAFKIVDEMMSLRIKIRVHTFNHLLHACISDKESGLRHALIVWRKMLKMREKPNIYSFNLMLKCVKECNMGPKEDIEELITLIQEQMPIAINRQDHEGLRIESSENSTALYAEQGISTQPILSPEVDTNITQNNSMQPCNGTQKATDSIEGISSNTKSNELSVIENEKNVSVQFLGKLKRPEPKPEQRTVPNLLSKVVRMDNVLSLQEVHNPQDKFAVLGGQEDFLKEMEEYSVKPDVKTFTQMLPLLEDSREAENKLLETIKALEIKTDIDFYNMLIKKRCLRLDYDGAFDIKDMIKKENEFRKKRYPLNKKLRVKADIMTYGVLALACKTKESAEKLLKEMKEAQIKVNIQILGALLRQGTAHNDFDYVLHIMNIVKEENLRVNDVFIKHLEGYNEKCANILQQHNRSHRKTAESFLISCKKFSGLYRNWLKEVNVKEALEPEHPWKQFRENYPETIQRSNVEIVEPKKFYKRNRKYVHYYPKK